MVNIGSFITATIVIVFGCYCIVAGVLNYRKTRKKCFIKLAAGAILLIIATALSTYVGTLYRNKRADKRKTNILLTIYSGIGLTGAVLLLQGYKSSKGS
jgi:uncharacterized membrane protein HdeD (DUF308 family)